MLSLMMAICVVEIGELVWWFLILIMGKIKIAMIIDSENFSCDGVNFHENGKIPGTVSFLQFEYCSSEIKIMISHKVILILTLLQDILSHLTIQNSITGLRS